MKVIHTLRLCILLNVAWFFAFIVIRKNKANVQKREEITLKEKENLIVLIEDIKNNLQKGETELLEKTLIPSIRTNFVKDEIQNINFSKVNIFNSKPKFLGERATNIVGFNIHSSTIYYEVEYQLKNEEWKIVKFKERRG